MVLTETAPAAVMVATLRGMWREAGYPTAAAFGRAVGVTCGQVRAWEDGRRPSWWYTEVLAARLKQPTAQVVGALWGEKPGDPCPCGCGGVKVLPDRPNAYTLDVSLPCGSCGAPRVYRSVGPARASVAHPPLCPGCSHRKHRTEFRCVGYDDHGVNRHARRCTGVLRLRPSDIRRLQRPGDGAGKAWGRGSYAVTNPQPKFVDVEAGRYRCGRCALGARAIAVMEERLRSHAERIRSGSQRREVLVGLHAVLTPHFHASHLEGSRRARVKLQTEGVPEHVRVARVKGRLARAWSGPNLPRMPLSICHGCRMLLFPGWNPVGQWHRRCLHEALRASGRPIGSAPPSPVRSPGRPPRRDTIARHFAWAVRHYLGGESLRAIARSDAVRHRAVQRGVAWVAARLPEPALVSKRYRLRVDLLRAAAASR